MWNAAVLAILIAVTGVYATRNLQSLETSHGNLAVGTAAEMGIYRNAVMRYFSDHDLRSTSASTTTLKNGGYLPAWSRLYQQAGAPIWGNYRDGAGVIYVFATTLPEQNVIGELTRLAANSLLFGVFRSGLPTLQSPVYGDTGIPISAISGMSIPDGAPVWIAIKK